jgi:hypothetical protein
MREDRCSSASKSYRRFVMGEYVPLPWKQSKKNGRVVVDSNGDKIATAATRPSATEAWLNARLIAAAPEMLAALKTVLQHGRIDDSESRMAMVAAAITKAEQ